MMPKAHEIAALMPLLIPALMGCLLPIAALDRDQGSTKWIRGAMFLMTLAALLGSFFYVTQLWGTGTQPGYGTLHMDRLGQFGAIFVLVSAALTVLQLWDNLHQEGWVKGETLSLLMFSVTGMLLFCASSNLMVLFVALELFSVPLYALTGTVRFKAESLEGGLKYFLTGAVASSFLLMGSALLYGVTGSLELTEIARRLPLQASVDPLALTGLALLVLGFLFKISAAPFHQWTPDAYEAAPHPIAAFMSVATKGAAVLVLMRVMAQGPGLNLQMGAKAQAAFAAFAALTVILGNLTALVQTSVKRMLAYSSISHAGYLLLGFVAGTPQAYAGIVYYLAAYLAMNLGAFGLLTALGLRGDRCGFEQLRGKGWQHPLLGVSVGLCLFSLAGIPPLAGFFGKYLIFKELIGTGHIGLAVLGVLGSLVSVYYYLRVLIALFLEEPSERQRLEAAEEPVVEASYARATVLVAAILVVVAGLFQGLIVKGLALPVVQDALGLMR